MSVPVSLRQGLGAALRRERDRAGLTADEVARRGCELGLRWHPATVGQIETGRRGLTAAELLLLPLIIEGSALSSFLDRPMALTPAVTATPAGFAALLEGAAPTITAGPEFFRLASDSSAEARPLTIAEALAIAAPWWKPGALPADASADGAAQARAAARREAERKAARSLGVRPVQVAYAAWERWGRGLTEQRDIAVRAEVGDDAGPAALKAARRRVTMALLRELRPVVWDLVARAAREGGDGDTTEGAQ